MSFKISSGNNKANAFIRWSDFHDRHIRRVRYLDVLSGLQAQDVKKTTK